ncbi:MAG: 2-C-methyl-D-erythritol 4-phosphate cytidylyltransferase [Clostridia bacterium]|nr:2-C-methyl-D-erythritol 4-phosphate cytidylyltransferase [Clostridia bacterium]
MIYAVIAAGGIGSRMGSELPKQYIKIGGKEIIRYTAEKFSAVKDIDKVIILCPEDWVSFTKELFSDEKITVIRGGKTRNETLMSAIDFIEATDGLDDDTALITHDAVRPFVTTEIIENNIDAVLKFGATGTAIPATDTIFEAYDGAVISSVPDRSRLYQAQTPQCFKALKLRELYESLSDEEKEILTDACKIYTIKGYDVHLVKGDVCNIKITYPHDLIVAEAILKS